MSYILPAGPAGTPGAILAYDANGTVEVSGTGKWKFPGYTADGTHPTAVGHAAIRDGAGMAIGDFFP